MEITKTYLMWVGSEHYDTISAYAEEAATIGISKRLPSIKVAKAVAEPGTVIFVAHDEGKTHECPDCVSTMECPECRKSEKQMDKTIAEFEAKRATKYWEYTDEKKRDKIARQVARLEKKLHEISLDMNNCEVCGGHGEYEGGTGGKAVFADGSEWDFVKYNYYLHQPKVWTPEEKGGVETKMCSTCGGRGKLPEGVVFGFFLPTGIEYVAKSDDDEGWKKMMAEYGAKVVEPEEIKLEARRGCGMRKGGGVYVMARPGDSAESMDVLDQMETAGFVKKDETTIHGNFVNFLSPVEIGEKRFRGIKRWTPEGDAKDEMEMAVDALE